MLQNLLDAIDKILPDGPVTKEGLLAVIKAAQDLEDKPDMDISDFGMRGY